MGWLISLTVVGALTTSLHAQGVAGDARERQQYRLTAEVLAKVEAVGRAYEVNLAKDPKMKRRLDAQRELDALDAKEDLTPEERKRAHELSTIIGDDSLDFGIDGGSLAEISAQLMKIPPMAAALKSAGMPARDMAQFMMITFEAALSSGLGRPVPPGAAGDNVRFVMANQAAIQRIGKLLGAR